MEDIRHEPNVEKYVRLEALPNLPVLGPKFKGNKAFGDIRNAITKLGTAELEEVRTSGSLTVLGHALEASDIIIQEKFVNDNVAEHEAIGGDRVIVLLDTRQNEALKTRGFAREIITRVQKLKKKAKLSTEDAIVIFYKFGDNAKYLNLAVENEAKTIAHAVKKPFFHFSQGLGAVDIVHDEGTIDDEPYHIKISAPTPIFNFQ